MILCIEQPIDAYLLHTKEENRRNNVYIFGWHRAFTYILFTAYNMSCKTFISNWKLNSRWASYAKGKNVTQAPREDSGPKEERIEEGWE